jgi:ketosteroid isomerase-like protein
MGMTREQMDQVVADHFNYEASDDVDGVMSTLTEDAEHEVVPSPVGALNDRDQQRGYYEMLFRDLDGQGVTPVRRYYGEDFLIDETVWHGHINDGRPFLCERQARAGELPPAARVRAARREDRPRAGVVRPGRDPASARRRG